VAQEGRMARHPKGMHAEDIKAALRRRHGTLRALASTWGKHPSNISRTLTNPRYSIPTEKLIAAALNMKPHQIWPDRWHENGDSPSRSSKTHGNEIIPLITSQKRRAD
jgi:Ner family transcriptional regulator